ncbi:exodeoxyribonuclease VII large subunit [Dongia sp. agr-C8]
MSDTDSLANPRQQPGHNLGEITVSELAGAIKRTLEGSFDRVRVRGEISGFKRAASGHLYMMLKDENAGIKAVCWRMTAGRLGMAPEDGMEVIVTGRITSYAERSEYQLVIERIELAGVGALLKMIEERRKKLAAEGLFEPGRKRKLPVLPAVIGVVTSPTGAVIRDILHRIADRFPRRVLVWPVLVQGEDAARQVAAAIRGFNALEPGGAVPRPDLLIVARGGGSIEDLMPFNEEIVVRAAAESGIPLISAVGHETDTTLIDFASDRRAPTPTAAAEMAVPVRGDLLNETGHCGQRLFAALARSMNEWRLTVEGLGRGLPDPVRLLQERTQQLDQCAERWLHLPQTLFARRRDLVANLGARLKTPAEQIAAAGAALNLEAVHLKTAIRHAVERQDRALERVGAGFAPRLITGLIERQTHALESLGRLLESYSYDQVLKRGFALVRNAAGEPVLAAAGVPAGERLRLQFHDGEVGATAAGTPVSAPKRGSPPSKTKPDQGSLL